MGRKRRKRKRKNEKKEFFAPMGFGSKVTTYTIFHQNLRCGG